MDRKQILWIDNMRVVATIFVVINHVVITAIHVFEKNASQWDYFMYNGINHFARFAVPCFLMITGYLLLSPERKIDYHKALYKYVWRMVVILLTVGTSFSVMELYFDTRQLGIMTFINGLWNVIIGKTWGHMWYLYSLIGLYLVVPVIKPAFNSSNKKILDVFLLIAFLFCCVLPTISKITGFEFGVKFPMNSFFLFYFILGGWLLIRNFDGGLSAKMWLYIVVVFGLLQFGVAYLEYIIGYTPGEHLKHYASPLMVIYSFAVFLWIKSSNMSFQSVWGGGNFE